MTSLDDLYPRLGQDHLASEKEIKVRIPMQQHIRLHTIKVLHGQSISDTVKAALDAYFRDFDLARADGRAERRLEAWAGAAPEGGGSTPR